MRPALPVLSGNFFCALHRASRSKTAKTQTHRVHSHVVHGKSILPPWLQGIEPNEEDPRWTTLTPQQKEMILRARKKHTRYASPPQRRRQAAHQSRSSAQHTTALSHTNTTTSSSSPPQRSPTDSYTQLYTRFGITKTPNTQTNQNTQSTPARSKPSANSRHTSTSSSPAHHSDINRIIQNLGKNAQGLSHVPVAFQPAWRR